MFRAVCSGLVAFSAATFAADRAVAEVGAGAYPTSQAIAADAQFLEYAPPPAQPGVVCLVDSGVDLNPDTVGALVGAEARDPKWGTGDGLGQALPRVDGHPAGHGTEMAMLMAAPQNGWGMVGIAPTSVRVYSIRVVPPGQTTFPFANYSYAITRCLQLRIRNQPGVNVVNLSLGGTNTPPATDLVDLEDSVDTARQHGLNVVGAAGNDGSDAASYPAAYPSVISVGAGDSAPERSGIVCSFTGGSHVDLVAPGCNTETGGIDQAFADDGTPAFGFGTSQAAALTSAVLSALRAYAPSISVGEAELCLKASQQSGGGLDVARAFDYCGLSNVVQEGLAAIPNEQAAGANGTNPSSGPASSVSTSTHGRLPTPRIALPIVRRGRLTIRALNRPRNAVVEVRVFLVRGNHRVMIAGGQYPADRVTFRVRRATSVQVRFVVSGKVIQRSPWISTAVG